MDLGDLDCSLIKASYRLIEEIHTFVHKESAIEFMKSLTKTDERVAQIANYYHQINESIAPFQVRVPQMLALLCNLTFHFADCIVCHSGLADAK